jgi:hypothetical protein
MSQVVDPFDSLSPQELRQVAAQGKLHWRGKKVVLDPFVQVRHVFVIEEGYRVIPTVVICGREEKILPSDELFRSGILQGQIFRFWEEEGVHEVQERVFTVQELKAFVDAQEKKGTHLVWKCPVPEWRPKPLPILQLTDRTGAFAMLWMDYGGEKEPISSSCPDELFWEKDLLETDFIKKQVGAASYYCPMDKVAKSLTFLLDLGWTLLDCRGKKIIRQGEASWQATSCPTHLLIHGKIAYGTHVADAKNVLGAFNRREKFIDLSEHEVGFLDIPREWEPLGDEEMVAEGIAVKRHHIGLIQEFVPLPPEYQIASWQDVTPGDGFEGKLFDYQLHGLCFLSYLYRSRFSGLLADEMGLGKTLQVIALLSTLTLANPVLIVMPVSLLFHWQKEFEKFLPTMPIYCHRGETRLQTREELALQKIILTSYAQLREDQLLLQATSFAAVILDEAQAIKNGSTQIAQIACTLQAPFKLAITGTPIENRYEDLLSIFKFLMPELLQGQTLHERVRKKIAPFTLRRKKSEVGLQLPEKHEQTVWVEWEPNQRQFYDTYLKEKRGALIQRVTTNGLSSQRMQVLELILRLRQICCHPKLVTGEYQGESGKFNAVCNDLQEVVASGRKVLLYSQFTSVLMLFKTWIKEQGWNFAYLDGETKDRSSQVERFQQDLATPIFLMSLKAGGVGLNLQAADYVFLYDPWWNEAVEQQAMSRAHRIGRQDPVIARKYLVAESIEEKIAKLQRHKTALAENLLEFEGEAGPIGLEELYLLLQSI